MRLGLEILQERPELAKSWGRCGLLCNQASVTSEFLPAWEVCREVLGSRLVALFGPQHGLQATVQDNMIETGHSTHASTGLPIFSLYSETREPTAEMVQSVDTLVVDIQIVGCRVYTFKYSVAACLRAAKKYGKKVVVLDRPNPLGGVSIAGNILEPDTHSFVGEFPIPMRHGLTVAEAARFFNEDVKAPLEWVAMEGWDPHSVWHENKRDWVITSPNLPTAPSVYVYPGTVMLEGTNISEGRGTGLPFQFVGAPYIRSSEAFVNRVRELYGRGDEIVMRPTEFQPTSQKWQGETCRGLQFHVMDPHPLRSFDLGLAVIRAAIEQGGKAFQWKQPPYEYNYKTLPIKLILGTMAADRYFEAAKFDVRDDVWKKGLTEYKNKARDFFLYPREMQIQ